MPFTTTWIYLLIIILSVVSQFSSVAQSCLTLCDPMNCSTPGLPVHHQLPESTHTHVHCVGDAIQPSHPPFPPSHPALNLPQHQVRQRQISYDIAYIQKLKKNGTNVLT